MKKQINDLKDELALTQDEIAILKSFITTLPKEVTDPIKSRHSIEDPPHIITKPDYYIHRIALQSKCSDKETRRWLIEELKYDPENTLYALMYEIALIMDEKYPNDIMSCETVYVVKRVEPLRVIEYRIALCSASHKRKLKEEHPIFRSMNDVKVAARILSSFIQIAYAYIR